MTALSPYIVSLIILVGVIVLIDNVYLSFTKKGFALSGR